MRVRVGEIVKWKDGRWLRGHEFKAFNGNTGKEIPYCVMADDETGEYEAYALKDGKPYLATDDQGRFLDKANVQIPKIIGRLDKIILVPPEWHSQRQTTPLQE